ncbi:MAG TPA: hypothetical protein VI932_01555, partial [Bacteroidota bacterium]|nr:hypothetical protein [Bacteroidota bacterium]
MKRRKVRPIRNVPTPRRSAAPGLLLAAVFMIAALPPSVGRGQSEDVLTLSDFRGRLQTLLADT